MPIETKLMTPKELATLLRVSYRTLIRLHERRKLPPAINVGSGLHSTLRWREADVRRWLERGGK